MKAGKYTSEFILIALAIIIAVAGHFTGMDFSVIAGEIGLAGLYAVLRTVLKVIEGKNKNLDELSKALPNVVKTIEEIRALDETKKSLASPSPPT